MSNFIKCLQLKETIFNIGIYVFHISLFLYSKLVRDYAHKIPTLVRRYWLWFFRYSRGQDLPGVLYLGDSGAANADFDKYLNKSGKMNATACSSNLCYVKLNLYFKYIWSFRAFWIVFVLRIIVLNCGVKALLTPLWGKLCCRWGRLCRS